MLHRFVFLFALALSLTTTLTATEPSPQATLQKAVGFLEADMARWRSEHGCAACHHGPLAVWSLHAAKQAGAKIDDAKYDELLTWLLTDPKARMVPADDAKDKPLPSTTPAIFTGIALQHVPQTDAVKSARERITQFLVATQNPDGGWTAPAGRPPVLLSADQSHDWARWAIKSDAAHSEQLTEALRRSDERIAQIQPGDDLAALLVPMLRRPRTEIAPNLVNAVRDRQQSDGGWKQVADEPTDPFATGMALATLRHAGVPSDAPAVQRAVAFLQTTQRDDGGWPMTSRPHPENKSRAGNLVPITYAGSAWAVIGLSATLRAE